MRPQHGLNRTLLGLALAAGLAWLTPSPARAQFTYGYNSVVTYPPSQAYWYGAGYSGVYTDTSTGVYVPGALAPFRGVAPYADPPFGQFARSNGLVVNARPNTVTVAPPPRPVVVQRRRGLLGRLRGR